MANSFAKNAFPGCYFIDMDLIKISGNACKQIYITFCDSFSETC